VYLIISARTVSYLCRDDLAYELVSCVLIKAAVCGLLVVVWVLIRYDVMSWRSTIKQQHIMKSKLEHCQVCCISTRVY